MHTQLSITAPDIAKKVLQDQVRALEVSAVVSRIATINMGLLSAWLCREGANHRWLLAWVAIQTIFNAYAIWTSVSLRRIPVTDTNVSQRLRRSIIIPATNGFIWAFGIWIMWQPDNFPMQIGLAFFVLGISTGSLNSLKPHLAALFLFFIPCVGSIVVATLGHFDQYSPIVLVGTISYMIWGSGFGITTHRSLIKSLYKHYEVEDLVNKLQIQKDIAESATEAKSRFLAAASHDMRQPMHALNLYLGVLANLNLPQTVHPVLDNIRKCAQTMDDMFSALLDISTLDSNVIHTNISVFPISKVLSKIQMEFAQQAQAKGIALRIAKCSAIIESDAELLENVLRNLVSNAVRYTKEGKILVGCRRTKLGIRCGVYDTGIGIAVDQQSSIFEEFFQVGNRERNRSQGLGLGLAIAQRQAKLMRAPLTLRSIHGRGSVFEIELECSALAPSLLTVSPELSIGGQDLSNKLIVIIDDETMILDATHSILTQWGCDVLAANSGAEALEKLATSPRVPDAIICDHRLQNEETGVEVIAALRDEFNLEIPAVLITGDTSPEQIRIITSAALPVLHKPLQSDVLKEMLVKLIINGN